MKIYKYKLILTSKQYIPVPLGAKILSCGQKNGDMFIWAMVNGSQDKIDSRRIRIIPTGYESFDMKNTNLNGFVGTIIMNDGLVWHIFEG